MISLWPKPFISWTVLALDLLYLLCYVIAIFCYFKLTIYNANQMTDFYMKDNTGIKLFKLPMKLLCGWE